MTRLAATLALGLVLAPLAAQAQPPGGVRRIGVISSAPSGPLTDAWWQAFVSGLREHGWTEGENIAFERRYAAGPQRDSALAAAQELIRAKVDVIVVSSTLTALAARQVTTSLPIVMTVPADPVATGLVKSLARPGGNVTGLSFVGTELAGKQVELLREAVPGLARIAVLANPANASHALRTKEIADVARTLKLQSEVHEARTPGELPAAFAAMARRRPGAAIVLADALFVSQGSDIIRLAAEQRLPVIYGLREIAEAGGLMAYGASFPDLFRRAASYVDKILRGARPGDLPVEQASKFELVINLKTARVLGLRLPPTLLARADRLID